MDCWRCCAGVSCVMQWQCPGAPSPACELFIPGQASIMVPCMRNNANTINGSFQQVIGYQSPHNPGTRHHRNQWHVTAGVGDWGQWCGICSGFLPYAPANVGYSRRSHTRCSKHGASLDFDVALRIDSVPLVEDHDEVFNRTWWHSSMVAPNDIDKDQIEHVGTRDAALHRALNRGATEREPSYLYKITLKPALPVEPSVWIERPFEEIVDVLAHHQPTSQAVVRYINGQEAPGDISLVLKPQTIAKAVHVSTVIVGVDPDPNRGGQVIHSITPAP